MRVVLWRRSGECVSGGWEPGGAACHLQGLAATSPAATPFTARNNRQPSGKSILMPLSRIRRFLPVTAALFLIPSLAACNSLALTSSRVQGYVLKEEQVAQIRPGQSQDLVTIVLGSPQTTNSFGDETAYYYISTKVDETAFGLGMVKERTVLAVYFDKNKRVVDKAVYGAKDGKVFAIESRRTPSFGEDRNFIESILSSI